MPQTGALRHERRRERAQLRVRATQIATLTLELLHVLFLPRAGLLRGLAVSNEPRAFLVVPRVGGVGVGGCSGAVAVASGAFRVRGSRGIGGGDVRDGPAGKSEVVSRRVEDVVTFVRRDGRDEKVVVVRDGVQVREDVVEIAGSDVAREVVQGREVEVVDGHGGGGDAGLLRAIAPRGRRGLDLRRAVGGRCGRGDVRPGSSRRGRGARRRSAVEDHRNAGSGMVVGAGRGAGTYRARVFRRVAPGRERVAAGRGRLLEDAEQGAGGRHVGMPTVAARARRVFYSDLSPAGVGSIARAPSGMARRRSTARAATFDGSRAFNQTSLRGSSETIRVARSERRGAWRQFRGGRPMPRGIEKTLWARNTLRRAARYHQ